MADPFAENEYLINNFKFHVPYFTEKHLNTEVISVKRQSDEFLNKGNGTNRVKRAKVHGETKTMPNNLPNFKNHELHNEMKLKKDKRNLSSEIRKNFSELPVSKRKRNEFFTYKNDTSYTESTEETFRQAYREFIDASQLIHLIEYLPPEKGYKKRVFKKQTHHRRLKKMKLLSKDEFIYEGKRTNYLSPDFTSVSVTAIYANNLDAERQDGQHMENTTKDTLTEMLKVNDAKRKEKMLFNDININNADGNTTVLFSEIQNYAGSTKKSSFSEGGSSKIELYDDATLYNSSDHRKKEFFVVDSKLYRTNVRRSNNPDIAYIGINPSISHTIGGLLEYEPWPWIVSIYKLPEMFHVCSGTLIDSRHILSAAHCYVDHPYATFVASVGNLLKISDPSDGYAVEEVIIHKQFTKICFCNDIALVRLVKPVDPQYTPICLPDFDPLVVGENATLLGWGDTQFMARKGTSGTVRLQRVYDLPITSSEECRKIFSAILHRSLPKTFSSSFLCAGVLDGSKDACIGDSGGPLLHQSYDGSWTLIGVVSFGYKCGTPGVPGIYTRVSYYLNWIYDAIDNYYLTLTYM